MQKKELLKYYQQNKTMKNKIDTTGLEKIRIQMNAPLIKHNPPDWETTIPSDIIKKLGGKGADVPFEDVVVTPNGTFEYMGRKVLLYIRDQFGYRYKFHIMDCSTLKHMRSQNRYERYVVTERRDGFFVVNKKDNNAKKQAEKIGWAYV
jgi:hypothetical protein